MMQPIWVFITGALFGVVVTGIRIELGQPASGAPGAF